MTDIRALAGALALALTFTATAEAQTQTTPPPVIGPPAQTAPAQPAYQPGYQPGYQPAAAESTANIPGLWIPGIIVFGVTYLIDLFVAAIGTDTGGGGTYTDWLYAPLIGPWGALANADDGLERSFAVLTGLLQTAGATMFILGLTLRRPVDPYYVLNPDDPQSARIAVDLAPLPGGGRLGVTLSHF